MTQANRIAILVLLAGCPHAATVAAPSTAESEAIAAAREVLAMYPGARLHKDGNRVRVVYGSPMTVGLTPQDAAEGWLNAHGGVFGGPPLELEELWATPVMQGRFTAFGYRQYIDGLPVEYGNVRILVLNAPIPRVVYAAATIAAALPAANQRMNLDGETARDIVSAMPLFRPLRQWSEPELAIYQGDGEWIDPILTWKFIGEDPNPDARNSKTFFVDTATGRLVHIRNEVYSNEVTGTVSAWATPGTLPDTPANPPTLQDVGEIRVRISGGPDAYTSHEGAYTIGNAGTSLVNIATGVGIAQGFGGRWVNVVPNTGTPIQQTIPITPPGQANFVLNPAPSQFLTAQVNAFIGTTLTYNYFRDRAPNFTLLDVSLRAVTGSSGSCNAFFQASGPQIVFLNAGGNCPNSAYSTVIAHEYGHFIVNRLNLGQGGFGEGYSDTTGMMVYDDGVVGRGFLGPGTILRDPIAANIQYPCSGGIHNCGQLLAGSWWRIRTNLEPTFGPATAMEMTRERQVAWSLISTGGIGSNFVNAAHPLTAIEVLTIDDDDGNINNGTPNWFPICNAFASHSIACPELTFLDFELPDGEPDFIPSDQPFDILVNVIPIASTAQPGSGRLNYRPAGGTFITVPMTELSPDHYKATLPAMACEDYVEFYFTALTAGGILMRFPDDPAQFFAATAGHPTTQSALETTFVTAWPNGWSATGPWHMNTACAPIGNVAAGCEQGPYAYYGRSSTCNYNQPTGANTGDLIAPDTQLPDVGPNGGIVLKFCYALETEDSPTRDIAELIVNGQSRPEWRLPDISPTTSEPDLYWATAEIDLTEFSGQSIGLRWRFDTVNNFNNNFRGWHLNNVRIETTLASCTPPCYANCTQSTSEPFLSVDDFTCFISAFAEASSRPHQEQLTHYANCDGSTIAPVLTVDDFTCFINAFAAGCP